MKSLRRQHMFRPVLAFVLILAVMLSLPMAVFAVNPDKTATLELTASVEGAAPGSVAMAGNTVNLTAGIAGRAGLAKGIVGLTMDIAYDSARLSYANGTITSLLDDFRASAYEASEGIISVVFYANDFDADERLVAAGDDLFALAFTVKQGVASGTSDFTPANCNFADYAGPAGAPEKGFETIAVTPVPEKASIEVSGVPATPVTFVAEQVGGAAGAADSTGIQLTFSQAVTGLTAAAVTVGDGTGAAVKGALSGTGTTWTIALDSVTAEGNVTVSVADFGTFDVMTGPQTVAVYKESAVQTKQLSYTVEYFRDGVLADTDTVTQTVAANAPDTLTVDKGAINTTDKYAGYVFDTTVPAPIPDTIGDGGVIRVYYVTKEEDIPHTIAVTPNHAILVNTSGDSVALTEQLDGGQAPDWSKVRWSVEQGATAVRFAGGVATGETVSVEVADTSFTGTVRIKAEYEGYSAFSTIEVVKKATTENLSVKLLDKKATINKAKIIGALVPVDIEMAAAVVPAAQPSAIGSVLIDEVRLFTQAGANKPKVYVDSVYANAEKPADARFEASMYGQDGGFLQISATDRGKTTRKVNVELLPAGADPKVPENWILAGGTIDLTVNNKLPTVKLALSNKLSTMLPGNTATITATGSEPGVVIDTITFNKTGRFSVPVISGGAATFGFANPAAPGAKATVKATVTFKHPDYKTPPAAKSISVGIVATKPGVKLSQTTLTLAEPNAPAAVEGNKEAAVINLLPSAKNTTWANADFEIASVTQNYTGINEKSQAKGVTVSVDAATGALTVKAGQGFTAGKLKLAVAFKNTPETASASLTLTIKKAVPKITPKPASITLSRHESTLPANGSVIATVPLSYSTANTTSAGWAILGLKDIKKNKPDTAPVLDAIGLVAGRDAFSLVVKDNTKLAGLGTHTLLIGSDDIKGADGQPIAFNFKLSVNKNVAKAKSYKAKGGIDITDPASAITYTLALTNSAAGIADVKILPGKDGEYFKVAGFNATTFQIAASGKAFDKGLVNHKLDVQVTLADGTQLAAKALTIKPKQAALKAAQSVKAVTLYADKPMTGQTVSFELTAPAWAGYAGYQLQAGSANAKFFSKGGFEIVQSGASTYTIRFKDGVVPEGLIPKNKTAPAALKSSYKLKFDLFAEGTFTEKDGVKTKVKGAKTTTVTVTVNISK